MAPTTGIWLKLKTIIYQISIVKKSDSSDALVLLTSIPSETSILSQHTIYNMQIFIYLYTNVFLKVYYGSVYFHSYEQLT